MAIKVDVDFLRVPETKAKIYFKQPDKVHFDSEGFAMLPKQVFNIFPSKLLEGDYTTIYVRSDVLDSNSVDIIKIIPLSDSSNILLSTVWIDTKSSVIRKIETATKSSGSVTTLLDYDKNFEYPLPFKIEIAFKMQGANISSDHDHTIIKEKRAIIGRQNLEGTVVITYDNYIVNKGIPDKIFVEGEVRGL
ncbi:MAG: hypothetical protein A2V66_05060 [Ignavibacteria bacterium RBG_13_36_8]|nr:MAG: hypothetical protein A2V66_05060 [Ignavibacteria bacterium RBG_13_36_8]